MMKRFLVFTVFLFFGLQSWADPIQDLIAKSGNSDKYPNNNKLIIFDSTRVEVKESGLGYFYTHRLEKILTTQGALESSVVKYDYDPLTAKAEIRKVVIYRADGTIEYLSMAKVLDYPAPARAIYWGARETMIEVGRLKPGDAVEVFLFKKGFTYALLQGGDEDERYIPPMKGHFYDIVPFWTEEPVLVKVYQLCLPSSKSLQYEVFNGEVSSSVRPKGNNMIYTFSKSNMGAEKSEPGMVAHSDVATKLLLSTSPDWKAKSLWFHGVNESYGSFRTTPAISAKVKEILKGARNEIDSVTLLTHWAGDEIRYSGISMGEGEGFTLHTGDMTFTDRCGVCKDKAGMLITLLRAAGFESYPAMTMAGSRIETIPADQFNHCVTVVKLSDGKYHLLDPTWVPFVRELWSSAEQQQNYLMGVPEGADLAETPVSASSNHYLRIDGFSEIQKNGTLRGGFMLTAEGQSDAAIRRFFTGNYIELWRTAMERELLKVSPLAQLKRVDFGQPYKYLEGPIQLQFQYEIPAYALITGQEIIFTPFTLANLFRGSMGHMSLNTSLKQREFPFRDRSSRLLEISETIQLPFACEMGYQPITESVNSDNVVFNASYSLDAQTLKVKLQADFRKRIYDPGEWPAFRQAVLNQSKMADEHLVLRIK